MEALDLFRHRSLLALLVLPLLLLVWTWRRRGRALVLPFDHSGAAHGGWMAFFLRCAESLPALLLALVILLLAGPQKWDEPKSKRVLTNIEFCVDVSGSMMARFDSGDRYEAAMKAINGFLDYRKGDAFGLTFFGNNVLHWVPLTTDISAFRCAPKGIGFQTMCGFGGAARLRMARARAANTAAQASALVSRPRSRYRGPVVLR